MEVVRYVGARRVSIRGGDEGGEEERGAASARCVFRLSVSHDMAFRFFYPSFFVFICQPISQLLYFGFCILVFFPRRF